MRKVLTTTIERRRPPTTIVLVRGGGHEVGLEYSANHPTRDHRVAVLRAGNLAEVDGGREVLRLLALVVAEDKPVVTGGGAAMLALCAWLAEDDA